METMTKTVGDFATFNRGLVGAMMKSGQIWTTGCQTLSFSMAAAAKAQLDRNVSFCRAIGNVQSPLEAMNLQSGLARSTVEKAVEETGNFTNATVKLVEETMTPFTDRMSLAVEGWSARLHNGVAAKVRAK